VVNGSTTLSSAELYDPTTGTFSVKGSLPCACYFTATALPNAKVLFTGGINGTTALVTSLLYDPTSGTFSNTASLHYPRENFASALLTNGEVLAVGGYESQLGKTGYLASAELYH
jgi:hypothetical protein